MWGNQLGDADVQPKCVDLTSWAGPKIMYMMRPSPLKSYDVGKYEFGSCLEQLLGRPIGSGGPVSTKFMNMTWAKSRFQLLYVFWILIFWVVTFQSESSKTRSKRRIIGDKKSISRLKDWKKIGLVWVSNRKIRL